MQGVSRRTAPSIPTTTCLPSNGEMLNGSALTTPRPVTVRFSIGMSLVCAGLIDGSARGMEPESILWRSDYGNALEEAKAGNRLLWIQFTGPWCPNCTRMERDSFPHPTIIEHARQSFVPLKLQSDVHEQLALHFNLSGLPATVLVAPNREIVAVHQGYLGPEEFDTFLREAWPASPGLRPPSTGHPLRR